MEVAMNAMFRNAPLGGFPPSREHSFDHEWDSSSQLWLGRALIVAGCCTPQCRFDLNWLALSHVNRENIDAGVGCRTRRITPERKVEINYWPLLLQATSATLLQQVCQLGCLSSCALQ